MTHTLIHIQSYLFIIHVSQPKVGFQFLIFKESSYMHIYFYTCSIIFIQSHILRLQMGSTTFTTGRRKSEVSLLFHSSMIGL